MVHPADRTLKTLPLTPRGDVSDPNSKAQYTKYRMGESDGVLEQSVSESVLPDITRKDGSQDGIIPKYMAEQIELDGGRPDLRVKSMALAESMVPATTMVPFAEPTSDLGAQVTPRVEPSAEDSSGRFPPLPKTPKTEPRPRAPRGEPFNPAPPLAPRHPRKNTFLDPPDPVPLKEAPMALRTVPGRRVVSREQSLSDLGAGVTGEVGGPRGAGATYQFFLPPVAFGPPRAGAQFEPQPKGGAQAPGGGATQGVHVKEFKHFDFFCDWDNGEVGDSSAFSADVKFHKQYYTWKMHRKPPSQHVQAQERSWAEMLAMGSAPLEHLLTWCAAIHPRSVHDYKPIIVLLQGALKIFLRREMDFFSQDVLRLRGDLAEAMAIVEDLQAEIKKLQDASRGGKELWGSTRDKITAMAKMQRLSRLAELKHQSEKSTAEQQREKEMLELKRNQDARMEETVSELEALRKLVGELRAERDELKAQLHDKSQMLNRTRNRNRELEAEGLKAQKDLEARQKSLQELEAQLQERLKQADAAASRQTRRNSQMQITKVAQLSEIERLREQQAQLMALHSTPFFNWAAYRPVVEMSWAACLVSGQVSLSVPWRSTLRLPAKSKLPYNAHILELPSGSVVYTPKPEIPGLGPEAHTIAVPAFSMITFPVMENKEGSNDTAHLAHVSVPGGTSIILPSKMPGNARQVTVKVTPNTTIYAPAEESDKGGGGQAVEITPGEPKPPPSANPFRQGGAAGGRRRTEVSVNMKGATVDCGSTLVSPMGIRSTMMVPTGCTYIFPMGQQRHMVVPLGSVVTLKEGGNSIVMVPAESVIDLPTHEVWEADTARDREKAPDKASNRRTSVKYARVSTVAAATAAKPEAAPAAEPQTWGRVEELQKEQPDCSISCPGGTVVELPQMSPYDSGQFKVTLPPLTVVEEEEATWAVDKLPMTLLVPPTSLITLPTQEGGQLTSGTPAALIARKMDRLGPEASSAALGALDPQQAADALSDSYLSRESAAQILSLARIPPAAAVVRAMQPAHLRQVFDRMHPDVVASILAELPHDLLEGVLKDVFSGTYHTPKCVSHRLEETAATVSLASQLLQEDGPIRHVVDVLLKLDAKITSKLIAGTQAAKAAYLLSRMAGRRAGGVQANMCAEQLHAMASMVHQLSTRYHHADIRRARLVEHLSRVKTEDGLFTRAVTLMTHFKDAYGISCTLTRMPVPEDKKLAEVSVEMGCERGSAPASASAAPKASSRKSAPHPTMKAAGSAARVAAGAKSGRKSAAPKKASREHRRQEAEEEAAAADAMELLISTEDVQWGGEEVPGRVVPEAVAAVGLDTYMDAKVLAEAQQEALEKSCSIRRGVLVVVPVILANGLKWGTLSHMDRSHAARFVLGGLGAPSTNSVPKAYESLELMAAAIAKAVENIEDVTRRHYSTLMDEMQSKGPRFEVTRTRAVASGHGSGGEEGRPGMSEDEFEAVAIDLQSYTYWRRRLAARLMKGINMTELEEMKGYSQPPRPVVLLMASLFVSMGVGVAGFEDILGPSLLSIPKAMEELWKYTRGLIKVDSHEPLYLPRLMGLASKGLARTIQGEPSEDTADDAKRVAAVTKMMNEVKVKDIEYASQSASPLVEWCFVQYKVLEMQTLLNTASRLPG